jgi:hypothetical protein
VVGLSKEETLENTIDEVLTNTDRRGIRKITLTKITREFTIDTKTLRQRLLRRKSKTESIIRRRLLTPDEENVIIAYIKYLYEISIPLIKYIISNLISKILTRRAIKKSN